MDAAGAFGDLQDLVDPAAAVAEAGVEVSGTPVAAASWNDANGRNLAVLSKSVEDVEEGETTRIFAAHHVIGDGETRRLREVQDFEEDCPFDTPAAFVAPVGEQTDELAALYNPWGSEPAPGEVRGPLEVTDLDGDQVGELTFAYEIACVSDVSPVSFKLLVLEDGEKYILRGRTWGRAADIAEYGPLEPPDPEPAEAEWPSALWQHAFERYELYAHDD